MSVIVQEYFWRISTVYEDVCTCNTNFSVGICYFISLLNILISNTNLFAILEYKLDGVGPVDYSPPPISPTPLSKKKYNLWDMWNLTRETRHVTPDTWHVTPAKWHMVGGEYSFKIEAL